MKDLHDIIPEILIINHCSYKFKFLKNEVYGYVFICKFKEKFPSILERISEFMDKYKDSIIALAPISTIPSIKALALATFYTYIVYFKQKRKIRNRALLLLSVTFAKKQLVDVINIINKYIDEVSKLIVVGYSNYIEDLLNNLKNVLAYCRTCQYSDWKVNTRFKEVYGIEPSSKREINEKIVITKINRHYLSIL